MSACDEIRGRADLFDWTRYPGCPYEDIYLRGDCRVYVQYGAKGTVREARLARSAVLRSGSEVTEAKATGRDKKVTVIAWLAA